MDEKFLNLAIKEAQKSKEPIKCGVVIEKGNKVLAKAFNNQRNSYNASAHAEINAIKKAGAKLKNKDLIGATIYCSCEPCVMCLTAITYAKIKKIVYKQKLKAVSAEIPVNIDLQLFLQRIN